MKLSAYPFAEKFGWVEDQYGVSWQIMFSSQMKSPQKVIPTLMFAGTACGRAEEAVNFYTNVFRNSKMNYLTKYGPEDIEKTETKAIVKHAGFTIENCYLALMDSGRPSPLSFEQAISFMVSCDTQEEIEYYWAKLTDGGKEIQCGWLNDKFGFPWQIIPTRLGEMMSEGTPEQVARVTEAFMKMVKFDLHKLEKAYRG